MNLVTLSMLRCRHLAHAFLPRYFCQTGVSLSDLPCTRSLDHSQVRGRRSNNQTAPPPPVLNLQAGLVRSVPPYLVLSGVEFHFFLIRLVYPRKGMQKDKAPPPSYTHSKSAKSTGSQQAITWIKHFLHNPSIKKRQVKKFQLI